MTRHAERRGHALIGTTIFLVLAMLLWAAVYQQTTGHLRVEKACRVHAERHVSFQRAMAWALTLLETGEPPKDGYRCRMIVEGNVYEVTFWQEPHEQYWVEVKLKDPLFTKHELAPPTFGG